MDNVRDTRQVLVDSSLPETYWFSVVMCHRRQAFLWVSYSRVIRMADSSRFSGPELPGLFVDPCSGKTLHEKLESSCVRQGNERFKRECQHRLSGAEHVIIRDVWLSAAEKSIMNAANPRLCKHI